jgi:hypothetical protein
MTIKLADNSKTETEKAARREARQERKRLNTLIDSLRPSTFNPLTNGQKLDALRDAVMALLKMQKGDD